MKYFMGRLYKEVPFLFLSPFHSSRSVLSLESKVMTVGNASSLGIGFHPREK